MRDRIHMAMERKGWRQRDLAEALGIRPPTLAQGLARGSRTWVHLDRIAELLEVSRRWLVTGEDPPPWAVGYDTRGDPLGRGRVADMSGNCNTAERELLEELRGVRATQTAMTEAITELVRRCRGMDDAMHDIATALARVEDLGPAPRPEISRRADDERTGS